MIKIYLQNKHKYIIYIYRMYFINFYNYNFLILKYFLLS